MLLKKLLVVALLGATTAASAGIYTPFFEPLGPTSSLVIIHPFPVALPDFTVNNGRMDLSFDPKKATIRVTTDNPGYEFGADSDFDASVAFDVSDEFFQNGSITFSVGTYGNNPNAFATSIYQKNGGGIRSLFFDSNNSYWNGIEPNYSAGIVDFRIQRIGDLVKSSVNGFLLDSRHVGFVEPVRPLIELFYAGPGPAKVGVFGFTVITPEAPVCTVTQFCGGGGNGGLPEPSSWVLLITGFGLTGATMRRRRMAVA